MFKIPDHIKQYNIEYRSPEWYDFRLGAKLGSSEIGTILGYNDWASPHELFLIKTGLRPQSKKDNYRMARGRDSEDYLSNFWRYWDGSEDTMVKNKSEGKVIRECYAHEGYLINPKFPWLSVEPDRYFYHEDQLCPLEIKTINGFHKKKYESGIPTSYVFQVQSQMMVLDCDYAELLIETDGGEFDVIPMERNHNICAKIEEEGMSFVQRVRMALENIEDEELVSHVSDDLLEFDHKIDQDFLKEEYQDKIDETIPSDDHMDTLVEEYAENSNTVSFLRKRNDSIKAEVRHYMKDYSVMECLNHTVKDFKKFIVKEK
jgi:putative phage-type endonuclease